MVSEAEKFKEEDEKETERIASKNQLESIAYSLKNTISESGDKLEQADKDAVSKKAEETITWLDSNTTATKEEFDDRLKELQEIANPIMSKLYQAGGAPGAEAGAGAAPGGFPGGAPPPAPDAEGPTVEEVD